MNIQELIKDSFDLASQSEYLQWRCVNKGCVNTVWLSAEAN